jgi:hypothetical protein
MRFPKGARMVGDSSLSRRMDDQLLLIMDVTSDWTVNGRGGIALARYHSLRDAVRAVRDYEAAGHHVFAVCKQPGDAIVLFREQIERIAMSVGIDNRHRRPASHTPQRSPQHSTESHPVGD